MSRNLLVISLGTREIVKVEVQKGKGERSRMTRKRITFARNRDGMKKNGTLVDGLSIGIKRLGKIGVASRIPLEEMYDA